MLLFKMQNVSNSFLQTNYINNNGQLPIYVTNTVALSQCYISMPSFIVVTYCTNRFVSHFIILIIF